MAIELASAYVSLTPSAVGFRKAIDKELGQVGDDVGSTGEDAGSRFGSGFASKAGLALAGAGLAIGGALVKGTMDAIDRQGANAQLAASLGLDDATAAKVGQAAGDAWANNFGDNIGQVNDAIQAVGTNLGDLSVMDASEIQGLAEQALTLSSILGEEVGPAATAVGTLIKNGLVDDTTAGFDLIAATAKRVPQELRGELLETVQEYSNQWNSFGIDGVSAMELVVSAFENGARNLDGPADAVKEFGLNMTAGTKPAQDALKELGLNLEDMRDLIDQDQGAAAFAQVARALSGVTSESDKARLYQDLLGGTFEQVGNDGLAAMGDFEGVLGDINGATQQAADTLGDTLGARLETLKRKGFDALIKVGERLIPFLEEIVGGVTAFVAAFQANDGDVTSSGFAGFMEQFANLLRDIEPTVRSVLGGIVDGAKTLFTFLAENQTALIALGVFIGVVLVAAFISWAVAAASAAIATIAATWPIIAIAAAIAALVAGVIWAYQNWGWFRDAVDAVAGFLKDTLWPILKTVASFIIDDLVPAVVSIVGWLAGEFVDSIKQVAGFFEDLWNAGVEMKDQVVAAFEALIDFVTGLPGALLEAGRGLWDFITQPFEDAMESIRKLWNDTVGGFSVTLPDWMPGVGGKGFTIPTLHSGGIVPGRSGSETLALLQAGEMVISAADTRAMMAVGPAPDGGGGRTPLIGTLVSDNRRPLLEELVELQHLLPAA